MYLLTYFELRELPGYSYPEGGGTASAASTEKVTDSNVEEVFRSNCPDYETATLRDIRVYSVPLDAPFSSSKPWPPIKRFFQRQFFTVDFHAFVVLHTRDGMFLAVEKQRDGVYVSFGREEDSVIRYFNKKPRGGPIRLLELELEAGYSTPSLGEFVQHLKQILPKHEKYELVNHNCKHFAHDLLKEAGIEWTFTTLTDIMQFRALLLLLLIVSIIYETSYHYNWYIALLVLLILGLLIFVGENMTKFMKELLVVTLTFALLLEGIFYTPLGAVIKRGAQYSEMWRSESWFSVTGTLYKCWLPLCYVMVYVHTTYKCFSLLLFMLRIQLEYLTDLCRVSNVRVLITRLLPVLTQFLGIVTRFYAKIVKKSYTAEVIICCIVSSVLCFSLHLLFWLTISE